MCHNSYLGLWWMINQKCEVGTRWEHSFQRRSNITTRYFEKSQIHPFKLKKTQSLIWLSLMCSITVPVRLSAVVKCVVINSSEFLMVIFSTFMCVEPKNLHKSFGLAGFLRVPSYVKLPCVQYIIKSVIQGRFYAPELGLSRWGYANNDWANVVWSACTILWGSISRLAAPLTHQVYHYSLHRPSLQF